MEPPPRSEESYGSFVLAALRRRWPIVLACLIVAPAVALLISSQQPKEYEAKAELLFRETHYEQVLFGSSSIPAPDPTRQAATNLKLVDLEAVARGTGRQLGIPSSEVRNSVSVAPQGEADLISVTANWQEPKFAARLANTYVHQYILLSRRAEQVRLLSAQRTVEQQVAAMSAAEAASAEGQVLQARANQLRVLAALQTGNAELATPAVPPSEASSPKPKRDAALGVVFGLLLGFGLALLVERLDQRPRSPEEIGRALRAPVLAAVPLRGEGPSDELEPRSADAFRSLYANLRFSRRERPLRSLLVASLDRGEGGEAVAWQLAAAAAESGARVLVIEADLTRATPGPGLTTAVANGASLQEVVSQRKSVGIGVIDVLEPGPEAGPPMSLLARPQAASLLAAGRQSYDLVLVTVPPLGSAADAIALSRDVDGHLLVVRAGGHGQAELRRLRAQLGHLGAELVGAVVTGSRVASASFADAGAEPLPASS